MKYEHQLRKLSSEERKNLSSEELFHSAEFSSYLQKMGETLLRHCGITKRLSLTILPTGIAPGWTDGKKEYLVPENAITEAYNDIYAKFTALLGIHFHEIAHIIYCDFAEEQKAIDKIKAGEFYGERPTPKNQAEEDALTEMKDALQNSAYRPLFQQIFNDVTNTIDDPHDEGKIIDEFGGGVCQPSSTLYMAVLRADLEVVERHNHSFTVSYTPLGEDATVDYGNLDFRFANNTAYPIKILAEQTDGQMIMTIIGTKTSDKTVATRTEVLETYKPETVEKQDSSLAAGETQVETSGITGYSTRTYKVITENGKTTEVLANKSTYSKRDEIVCVGTGS